jgi:glucose-1-phosphate cytidylyltransferase
MKVVVLAGGLGTRLSEETEARPKPMVEIGSRPILWHILKHYAHFGFREFYLALGYKGESIKRFFLEYHSLSSNMSVSLRDGNVEVHDGGEREDWLVHLIETGLETNTGGRLKRLEPFLGDGTFMLTYGDGVSDVDLGALLKFHRAHGKLATVTAVRPPSRFGGLIFDGDRVSDFEEKPQIGEGWINGGFMVFEPEVFRYLREDDTVLESDALEQIAADGQLAAYRHEDFWQCMDTLRDLRLLEELWESGNPPWKMGKSDR